MKRKLITASEFNELPKSLGFPKESKMTDSISEIVEDTLPLTYNFSDDYKQPISLWNGFNWVKRDSSWKSGGPQANDSWKSSLSDFQDELTLNTDTSPSGSEVVSVDSMGYGKYSFRVRGNFNSFGPNTVFGAFLFEWDDKSVPGYREVDLIEISRWGGQTLVGKFTYYPTEAPKSAPDFVWTSELSDVTIDLSWEPEEIVWVMTRTSDNTEIYRNKISDKRIPKANNQQFHFNLWHFNGPNWQTETAQTVTVSDFSFTPSGPETSLPTMIDRTVAEKLKDPMSLTNLSIPDALYYNEPYSSGALDIFKSRLVVDTTNLIVVSGSNTSNGTGIAPEDSWKSKLNFGAMVNGYDSAISGVYTEAKYTLDVSVDGSNAGNYLNSTKAGKLGELNPSLVIHHVAENDCTYSWGSPEFVYDRISNIINSLDYTSTKPVGHLIIHGHERFDENLDYNWEEYLAFYRKLVLNFKNVSVLNISDKFNVLGVPGKDPLGLLLTDKRNASTKGHKIYASNITKSLGI